jgi:hypothetical protein
MRDLSEVRKNDLKVGLKERRTCCQAVRFDGHLSKDCWATTGCEVGEKDEGKERKAE